METDILTLEKLMDLKEGYRVNADDIAKLSGQSRMKGIHPIETENYKAVAILCTIGSEHYPNEWLDIEKHTLKYYLEGRTDKRTGRKTYNRQIRSNCWIINSRNLGLPIYVFTRKKKGELFHYEGIFECERIEVTLAKDEYFLLKRKLQPEHQSIREVGHKLVTIDEKELIRKHLKLERELKTIKSAIQLAKKRNGKVVCEACEFDFESRYGERGKNFIEVHLTTPLSELANHEETKTEDMVLLCANCHRMIHRKRPWLRIEELKNLISLCKN